MPKLHPALSLWRTLIRQELKFLAHSESGLKPTPEPVSTGFRYEAGI